MTIATVAHINFRGQARDALSFYRDVFGGEIAIVTHAQAYGTQDPAEAELVSWGQVRSDAGFAVMASDIPSQRPWDAGVIPYFISVRSADTDEIAGYWEKLADGATILQPLAASGWARLYGMLEDRFGISWVLDVPTQPAG
ncbi:VOC family protein [Enterovirga rhinocerotis]|uniref:PhnB protein n=1 Tax=Enterovirga rhinocerotis TaxID=1339210 RepID=A0A4R7BRA6_9HYPH|nr:VOC family protein [Enterovirga rhinocerotis]TDR88210.1 PhnB protein [Enterovirga rhinocerotis]